MSAATSGGAWRLRPLDADALGRLEPLWRGLHRHHRSVGAAAGPFVPDDLSWKRRQRVYRRALAEGGRILLAESGGEAAGYVAMQPVRMPWPATFAADARMVEILSLVVRTERRSRGEGSRLLAEADAFARQERIGLQGVGLVAGNDRAAAFYARHGFRPAWLTLARFGARPEPDGDARGIEAVRPEEVDRLRDLWLPVHRHHQAVNPELGPYVDDDTSWSVFRPIFLAAARKGLLLRAGTGAAPLGIAVIDVAEGRDDFADTWPTGAAVAEIDVMAVREDVRGRGIGTALLAAAGRRLAERGVTDCVVGAIAGNAGAIRLYARSGFRPIWAEMIRWAPRHPG